MMPINVAFWNLENFFDAATAQRPPALASKLRGELNGWTAAIRNRKAAQLASVTDLMFGGAGPDLLGVCEVENETVLGHMTARMNAPGRDYQVVAHASPDARGIDASFIHDANTLAVVSTGHQVVVKRNATRDLFWTRFRVVATNAEFVAVANHWPARSGGQYASEPFRMLTGETLSFRLSELLRPDDRLPILLMGDFNDEPFNRSMQEYLLGQRDRDRVTRARTPMVWNLMWPLMTGDDPGSYKFGSDWNMLDQFLASKGMVLTNSPVHVDPDTVEIFRPPILLARGGKPRKFGRPSKNSLDEDGYSDHFPITVVLET